MLSRSLEGNHLIEVDFVPVRQAAEKGIRPKHTGTEQDLTPQLRVLREGDTIPTLIQCSPGFQPYAEARKNLTKVDWAVDYVITHCAPTSIALMENRHNEADPLTDFLQEVKERAHYHYWLFGHYHDNRAIDEKHILLWEQIVQVI